MYPSCIHQTREDSLWLCMCWYTYHHLHKNVVTCKPEFHTRCTEILTCGHTFPSIYLYTSIWCDIGSNFQCINIFSIIWDAKWTEGLIEVTPFTLLG